MTSTIINDWRINSVVWLMKISLGLTLLICLSFGVVSFTTRANDWVRLKGKQVHALILSKLPQQETIQFLNPEAIPVERVLDMVSQEMKFDPMVLRAMALQESGGYTNTNRVRGEPQLLDVWRDQSGKLRPARIVPPPGLNEIEKHLWASSHGALQIIFGFHYKTCGLNANEWDKLHVPLVNIRCGAKILQNNARKYSNIDDQSRRLWFALRDYNNSDAYADQVMARIARLHKFNFGEGL